MNRLLPSVLIILLTVSMLAVAFNLTPTQAARSPDAGLEGAPTPYDLAPREEAPPTEWNKTFNGEGESYDVIVALVQTSDGGYALAGYTYLPDADFWLVKTDAAGNHQWNKTYGGTGSDFAYALAQTTDGGYALAGFTDSFGATYDSWLVKTDASGNHQWNRTYGVGRIRALVQTSDSGYALAGSTKRANYDDFWLVKADEFGNPQWNKTYGRSNHDGANALVQTSDGGYALAGSSAILAYPSYYHHGWLIKTDALGHHQWNKTYVENRMDCFLDIVQTSDGDFALAGYTHNYSAAHPYDYDFWLVKTDASGTMQWSQAYGGTEQDHASALVQASDGGYALVGRGCSFEGGTGNAWLVKTDQFGNQLWNQTWGGSTDDGAFALVQASDGGYTLAGATSSFPSHGAYDGWLIKTAPDASPKFSIGDWVRTTANLNVRTGPGLGYAIIDTMPLGTVGQVLGGPMEADGFVWWDVNYTVGARGWSVENWLELHASAAPTCVVELQIDGVEVSEVGVGQFFDIYVGDSTDDIGIRQVRFSSDESQDNHPTGEWTQWYDWEATLDDWDSMTKIKRWAFASSGYKEVWAEVKDDINQIDRRLARMYVPGNQPPICVVILQRGGAEVAEVDQGKPIQIYVGDSTDDAAIVSVMFSSDDLQDDFSGGEWTEIFDWNSNRGDWHAGSKTMEWVFETSGRKEVWALIKDSDGNVKSDHADILVHPGYAIIVAGEGGLKEQWGIDAAADNAYRVLQSLGFDDDHITYLNSRFPRDLDSDGIDDVDGYAARSYFEDALETIRGEIAGCSTPFILYLTGHGDPVGSEVGFYFGNWVWPDDYIFNDELSAMLNEFADETPMLVVLGCCYSGTFITSPDGISGPNRMIITAAHDGKRNYIGWLQSSDRFFGNLKSGLNVRDAFTERAVWGDNHNMWLDDNGDRVGHPPNDLQNDGVLSSNTHIGYLSAESLALMPWGYAKLGSPGEVTVLDSANRVTGMVNGGIIEEIPNSFYDEENNAVVIFWSSDSHRCNVRGNDTGTYGLEWVIVEDGYATIFSGVGIATTLNETHLYSADWSAIQSGEEGVDIQVDINGDGWFEHQFLSDATLNGTEFEQAIAHDVAIAVLRTAKSGCLPRETVAEGRTLAINVTVQNQGKSPETFTVTLYANATVIGTHAFTVSPGTGSTFTFHWDTTGFVKGDYLIRVVSDAVANETDMADNTLGCGYTCVTVAGDVDGDRRVSIFDIVRMAGVYGIAFPDPRYDPNSDIDGDGDVDIFDVVAATGHYGESW
jgi:hypothetical protein